MAAFPTETSSNLKRAIANVSANHLFVHRWQMADDQESIGSAQRLAMRIICLPKDRREAGLETVRRIFSEEL